jgi:hypothetical protein
MERVLPYPLVYSIQRRAPTTQQEKRTIFKLLFTPPQLLLQPCWLLLMPIFEQFDQLWSCSGMFLLIDNTMMIIPGASLTFISASSCGEELILFEPAVEQ